MEPAEIAQLRALGDRVTRFLLAIDREEREIDRCLAKHDERNKIIDRMESRGNYS